MNIISAVFKNSLASKQFDRTIVWSENFLLPSDRAFSYAWKSCPFVIPNFELAGFPSILFPARKQPGLYLSQCKKIIYGTHCLVAKSSIHIVYYSITFVKYLKQICSGSTEFVCNKSRCDGSSKLIIAPNSNAFLYSLKEHSQIKTTITNTSIVDFGCLPDGSVIWCKENRFLLKSCCFSQHQFSVWTTVNSESLLFEQ